MTAKIIGDVAGQLLPGLLTNPWADLGSSVAQMNAAADTTLNHAREVNKRTDQLLKVSRGQVSQAVQVTQAVRNATPPPDKKDNTMTYVLVGTGTALALGIAVAIFKT